VPLHGSIRKTASRFFNERCSPPSAKKQAGGGAKIRRKRFSKKTPQSSKYADNEYYLKILTP